MTHSAKSSLWLKLKDSLIRTRTAISGRVDELVKYYREIDDPFFEELEETLILCDVGAALSAEVVSRLRERVKREKIGDSLRIKGLLAQELGALMPQDKPLATGTPLVILMVGVNGTGKTTATGKLAHWYRAQGKTVLLAAADTFRAAAIEQLGVWAQRAGVAMIAQGSGSDPAAVVFDAAQAAKARRADVLIVDTAGRLHNKSNLMNELAKIARVLQRELPDAAREVWLVLDATTGQNARLQAEAFAKTAGVTGLIVTKLDSTAKGGVIFSICREQSLPVRFVGIGETIEDLEPFNAQQFTAALFDLQEGESAL